MNATISNPTSHSTTSAPSRSNCAVLFAITVLLFAGLALPTFAGERYLKLVAGIGDLDDGGSLDVDDPRFSSATESGYDQGFRSGLAFGWMPNEKFALELEYLYSTNDLDEVIFSDGQRFDEGNYASVVISANGYYFFRPGQSFRPYVGAGLGLVQEVDIDFETADGEEISFETDDFGFQVMAGFLWQTGDRWSIDLQARYLSVSSLEMEAEEGPGVVRADYEPLSLLAGISYRF